MQLNKDQESDVFETGRSVSRIRLRNAAIFIVTALIWIAIDRISKSVMTSDAAEHMLGVPYLGLFEFKLAYNTGGAWSVFSDMTGILAVVSLLVCLVIVIYLFVIAPRSSKLAAFSLGLIFAGGIGNAIDRIVDGYVTDFISLTFIDFPIFNIADVGVTCGMILFVLSLFLEYRSSKDKSSETAREDGDVL